MLTTIDWDLDHLNQYLKKRNKRGKIEREIEKEIEKVLEKEIEKEIEKEKATEETHRRSNVLGAPNRYISRSYSDLPIWILEWWI